MKIVVEKLTTVDVLRRANQFTTGNESKMSLETAYRTMHTPARTQIFVIEFHDIPLFVASQFVRSKIGVDWFMRSKRIDRGGEDFRATCRNIAGEMVDAYRSDNPETIGAVAEQIDNLPNRFDRYAPTDLMCIINAEAIVNMSHKRLCKKASTETREIWWKMVDELYDVDPALANNCVPQCVYRGGICPEHKPCGFIHTMTGTEILNAYKSSFTK